MIWNRQFGQNEKGMNKDITQFFVLIALCYKIDKEYSLIIIKLI